MAALTSTAASLASQAALSNARVFSAPQQASRTAPAALCVRASAAEEPIVQRRALLSLTAAALAASLVPQAQALENVIIQGPPPPSGGLPGTQNEDLARDTEAPLKERFYLQPTPDPAGRVKEAVQAIKDAKPYLDRKAWPYLRNELRLEASYLQFDLNTIAASKSKEERKAIAALQKSIQQKLDDLDYAARTKDATKANKLYSETITVLGSVEQYL